jgi:hypothetical protein
VVAALFLAAVTAQINSSVFESGNELYDLCTSSSAVKLGACSGYIMGVSDAESVLATETGHARLFCEPDSAVVRQDVDIVKRYLENHPELRHLSAASMVVFALQQAFPCK